MRIKPDDLIKAFNELATYKGAYEKVIEDFNELIIVESIVTDIVKDEYTTKYKINKEKFKEFIANYINNELHDEVIAGAEAINITIE